MKDYRLFVAVAALGILTAALVASGCSGSREDVRVTLCKDIVTTQLESSVTVTGTDAQAKGYEHAAVRVRFSTQGRDGQAVCYYDYNAVEDTALHLSEPLSAYATSPFEVSIDGKKLSRPALAEAVKQAMLKQGREFVDHAKEKIDNVLQR